MQWAVAVAAPQQVEKVVEQLRTYPLPYFFPRVKTTVRHRGKRIHRFSPLLFNYIPVCLAEGWQAIFSMRGVNDVIGPLRSTDVDRLKAACQDGIYKQQKVQRFKFGQAVKPLAGPLADKLGIVDKVEDDEVKVLFNSFGRMVSIGFDVGNLVAA